MQVYHNKKALREVLDSLNLKNKSIGFVPTMGALHQGHLSLVKRAFEENNITIVSIFVNPTQFDNANDLEKYPSNLEKDITLLSSISDAILVFAPSKEDIYDGNVNAKDYAFDGLDKVMEGAFRKGHFDGVATIVELLFKVVQPTKAYFGEKDFQQLQIIKKLVAQTIENLEIIPCPIEREANGLARSSRNERLSKSTREEASFIFSTLTAAKNKFGMENANDLKEWVAQMFEQHPIFTLEYFEITIADTLEPVNKIDTKKKYRAFIAVYAEDVRLIDNIALN